MITIELVELKHKVLSERIDRLYNIFIVLSQDEKNISKLNAIKVIKEQYEKMYQAIIQSGEYDKYEEVENTIMPKLAQIEHHLDLHIYRTAPNCEELIDSYIKEIEKYDNYDNLDGELDKIKALKEMLKLYNPYINQELKESLAKKISVIKFEILLRKQISYMKPETLFEIPNVLIEFDSKQEKETFKSQIEQRFKWHIDKEITRDTKEKEIEKKRKQCTEWIMQNTDIRSQLLKKEIDAYIKEYKERFEKAHAFMRILYKTEKINKKIDTTEILNMQEQIKKLQEQLDEAFANSQYNKYLEIRANIIPKLEELERKIDEIGGLNYILETIISKEYHLWALLEEEKETPRATLEYVMKLYYPNKLPEEDGRYNKAEKMYQLRKDIRRVIGEPDNDWRCMNLMEKYPELQELFDFPIFNKSVLNYETEHNKIHIIRGYAKIEYLSELFKGEFSLSDWIAFGNIYKDFNEPLQRINKKSMNYSQKLVWNLYQKTKYRNGPKPPFVHYLVELDEEVVIVTNRIDFQDDVWPVGGEEFYKKQSNFYWAPYGADNGVNDLNRLSVRTKQLLIKKREIKIPLDETKMKKVSDEEAEELKQKVNKGSLDYNVDNIINSIFDLWPETEKNKQRRGQTKKAIRNELMKMGTEHYTRLSIQKIECHELYEAIKNEINRIRVSSTNYKNCHDFQSDIQYMVHLLSFVYEFLEDETDFQEFGGNVEFEILLKLQIEKMLYQNGGAGTRSEFFYPKKNDIRMNFLKYTSFEFGKTLSEYLGAKGERINFTIVDDKYKLNEILLNDMNARPEKYLFVLDAPEENSIVPKETRDKIAECARRIKLEESELSER